MQTIRTTELALATILVCEDGRLDNNDLGRVVVHRGQTRWEWRVDTDRPDLVELYARGDDRVCGAAQYETARRSMLAIAKDQMRTKGLNDERILER